MRTIKSTKVAYKTIAELKRKNKRIGFVPTMGALHKGHLSLLKKARKENDVVVLSIFVNPTQFGPNEDYNQYPRYMRKDKQFAKNEKVDIIFYPSVEEIYRPRHLTSINVEEMTNILCGKRRKGHFSGVTTIVGKLLNIIDPDNLYLGQKDYQQAHVIRQMVDDLNYPCRVKICPTVRETDGLALSSRNSYLSPHQRSEASILYQSLKEAKKRLLKRQLSLTQARRYIAQNITQHSKGRIEYIECVDSRTLKTQSQNKGSFCIALAVHFKSTRLIDNIIVRHK